LASTSTSAKKAKLPQSAAIQIPSAARRTSRARKPSLKVQENFEPVALEAQSEEVFKIKKVKDKENKSEAMNVVGSASSKKEPKPDLMANKSASGDQDIFSMYAYKGDLANGLRAKLNLCLWLRDGKSLMKKFFIDKANEDRNSMFFNVTNVYSCWLENREDEYLKVKVKRVKNGKVELLDIEGIEKICNDENFAELDLEPYLCYVDEKREEAALNGVEFDESAYYKYAETSGNVEDGSGEEEEESENEV
jgi:hypothetical protein